ncbi:MAG: anti-sigma factor family protein [Verrucomicrobiales bacterium]
MKSDSIQTNDPSSTAYALGELSPSELFQFEQQLKSSPKATAELEGIEETVDWLRRGFASELQAPRIMLEPVAPTEEKVVEGNFKKSGMKIMLSGLAAVLAGVAAVGALISNDRADLQNNQIIANANPPRVELTHPAATVETPTVTSGATAVAQINPGFVNVGYTPITSSAPSGYDLVDGMIVPQINPMNAYLNAAQLPDIVTIAATNNAKGSDSESLITYDNLSATPILEIDSNSVAKGRQLPGISDIGSGKSSYGTYKFQNEASKELSDSEFGHGNLDFEIRSRVVDGKLVEIVRLVDTRTTPDGKESKTVKEFVREGADVGKSIESLLPQMRTASASPTLNVESDINVPTIGNVTSGPVNPLVSEFFMINSELSAVRDAMAKNPAGAELKALEQKLSKLIERQETLGQKMERSFGGM